MAQGLFFNIEISAAGDTGGLHQAFQENISANSTFLGHPLANGRPEVFIFITANWDPGGSGGVYDNSSIGVWYDENAKKWAIFNQDLSSIPDGAAFNFAIREA